ncbi:MAG TPA: apolipoprotein N-acyltransferase [Acidisarcina sp.]
MASASSTHLPGTRAALPGARRGWRWGLAALSAILLDLPFPIAGPLPVWRSVFAWFALVPLIFAVLSQSNLAEAGAAAGPSFLRRSFLLGYLAGVIWYVLNCYWIYATMHIYGGIGAPASAGILLLYSMVLGLYFGAFTLLLAVLRKGARSNAAPLILAPFVWVALELLAARFTSVPWDQLGYSQVDNFLLTRLAPLTGVYGISLVLAAGNALLAGALLARLPSARIKLAAIAVVSIALLQAGSLLSPAAVSAPYTAVLLQQNVGLEDGYEWQGPEWDRRTRAFLNLSAQTCGPYYVGMPGPHNKLIDVHCFLSPPANLVVWPESPAPFRETDPQFKALIAALAAQTRAPLIVGNIGGERHDFNSGEFIAPDGHFVGRYDKIHLVPFGEYVPYKGLISFAGTLTQGVGQFSRGEYRKVFESGGHSYGIFICYESVFADEIRHFAELGADVFVNISDDGWYGDTSAPWQHLNMARMRAIENDRWILRGTDTGVTAAIDPYGRITQSAPRHVETSLAAHYSYRDHLTFYTRYGDIFAILCTVIALAAVARSLRGSLRHQSQSAKIALPAVNS